MFIYFIFFCLLSIMAGSKMLDVQEFRPVLRGPLY
jgi:hypothetical protein